ncbi:MAG: hypothetical protein KAI24_02710 [Planctomycetes bacterium]|nr:hypothetical protein [Planctomycetota bacterium]
MSRLPRTVTAIAAIALAATIARAQDVAVLYTTGGANDPCWGTDPAAKITGVGWFASVTAIDVGVGATTPTLAQLQTYNAVLVMQDYPGFQDEVALGDNLADYVDLGYGVVVAGFATYSNWQPLGGRWATGGYYALVSNNQQQGGTYTLGTVYDPAHLSMLLVTTFDGGSQSYRPAAGATVAPGARRIADWSDGTPLVVQGSLPNRVDLGFFPPSTDCSPPHGWNASTDGAKLMANSLLATIAQSGTQQAINETFGAGCGGLGVNALTRPVLGTSWDFELTGVPSATALALMTLDTVNPNLALGPVAPGCSSYTNLLLTSLVPVPVPTPAYGLFLPANPAFLGQEVYAQGAALVPGINPLQIIASNGIKGTIGDF